MTIPISVKTSSTNRKDSSGGRYSIITMRTMGMKNLLNYIEKEKSVLANSRIFPFISETYYNMSEEVRISRETNQRLSSLLLATFAWALSIHQNPESSIAEATNDAIKMMVFNNRVIQMKDLYPTYSEFSGGEYRETVDTTKVGKKIKATNLRKGIHAIYDQQEGYNYKELLSIFYQQRNFAIKRKIRG